MCVEDGEGEHQNKKDTCQPSCDGGEHVRGLGSENILGHATAERRPKSLALRPLHQNDKHHEDRDDRLNYEQEIDQNGHGDGQYGQSRGFVHDEGAQERNLTTDLPGPPRSSARHLGYVAKTPFTDFTDGKEEDPHSPHRHFAVDPDAVHDSEAEHDHERKRTAVTNQRQRNAGDGQNRNRHPDILKDVGENQRRDADHQ